MSTDNPYSVGGSALEQGSLRAADGSIDRALYALAQTRPWVRFLGILTLIGTVLIAFGALAMGIFLARGNAVSALFLMFIYGLMAVAYGFAAKFLLSYASAIAHAEITREIDDIAIALEHQKSFWKLAGVCTAVFIVLYVAAMLMMVVGGALMGSM